MKWEDSDIINKHCEGSCELLRQDTRGTLGDVGDIKEH